MRAAVVTRSPTPIRLTASPANVTPRKRTRAARASVVKLGKRSELEIDSWLLKCRTPVSGLNKAGLWNVL